MMRRLSRLSGVLLLVVAARPAQAQERWVERPAFYLGLNVLIGGASAFAQSFLSAADVHPGTAFLKGAAGGAVTFGGQKLTATGEPSLRLAGVQVAALGSNLARNAGHGVAPFSDLVFPLPPFYLRVRPGADDVVSIRVSALSLATLGMGALDAGRFQASVDWRETLLAGAPVFRSSSSYIYPFGPEPAPECRHGDGCPGWAAGMHRNGINWYTTGGRSSGASARILAHEILHLTQVNRDAILHAIPMSDAVLTHVGGPLGWLARYVVVDAYLPLTGINHLLSSALPAPRDARVRLYELEADALMRR